LELYNWYIQGGLLCGDLCLVNMRQNEYRLEKETYKTREYILKNDKKYKKSHPLEFRFHLFVKLQIISINNNIAMVNHKEISELIQNASKIVPKIGSLMCREHHSFSVDSPERAIYGESRIRSAGFASYAYPSIIMQNMDSYFFLNDVRKKKMENQLHKYINQNE